MSSFLKSLFEMFGGSKPEVAAEAQIHWDSLFPEDLEVHSTFRHGLPYKPSCMAYDCVQALLAIGSHRGDIVILGKPHLERHFTHGDSMTVLQMIFIENKGLLVTRCSNNLLYLWNIKDKHPKVINTLKVKGESPCLLSWRFGSNWIYVGTEQSNVYVVNLSKFQLSEYSIQQESVVTESSASIGELVAISEQPHHKKKLLLAYMNGICVLWNLEGRLIKRQFSLDATQNFNMLIDAVWHASGHRFAAAYSNGSIAIFNADDGRLERTLTSRGSPEPAFQLQWFNVDAPDSWLIFAGIYSGPQGTNGSHHLTIHTGQETKLISFPDPIVSFLCLPSCPYAAAMQEQSCLAVLTQEEIVFLDLLSPSLLPFSLAHPMDLNSSPVTSVQFCGNCPDELVALLAVMSSKNRHTDLSTKVWPLIGGRWGEEPLDSWTDLLVTGHMDGSIRFWICRSATTKLLFVINTTKYFKPAHGTSLTPTPVISPPPEPFVSPPPKPVSLPLVNGTKAPEVTIEADDDNDTLLPGGGDELQKEDGTGAKLRPSLGVFKKSTSKIGKIVSRSKSTRLSASSEENALSPTAPEGSSSLGDDDSFSLTKRLRGSMRLGRPSTSTTEYIAYESATTYAPLSPRRMAVAHIDEEDGEHFAIHKLNMDIHSQTLVAANCGGHVLVLDFLSRPFKKHSIQQSLEVDFGKDTVFHLEEEEKEKDSPLPPFAVCKWAFYDGGPYSTKANEHSIPSDAQLIHHCHCFLKKKGVPLPVAITGIQFNRDSKILAIGSEEGLAIIDISWNKCVTLMAQHLSLLYMADPRGHRDQMSQQWTHPQDEEDQSSITRSEYMRRVNIVRKNSLPFQHQISLKTLSEIADSPTEEEGRKVTCLEFVRLILQKGQPSKLTMWVGTASGHVMVYTINIVEASQLITDSTRELVPTGIIIALRSQVNGLYFLNERGQRLVTTTHGSQPNSQAASKKDELTYTVICSRNFIKSLAFPGSKDVGFHEPEISGGYLVSNGFFKCQGLPCLMNLTSSGDILIHNLPTIHHLTTVPYAPLHNPRALQTFQVSGDGQAVHFISPSEIQRLSVTKDDQTNLPNCLPDLFLHRPDPDDPLAKRKGFSSSKVPSDRSHLFGEQQVSNPVPSSERKTSRDDDPSSFDAPKKRSPPSIRHRGHGVASSSSGRRSSREEDDNIFSKTRHDPSSTDIPKKRSPPSTRHRGHGVASSSSGRRSSREEDDNIFLKTRHQLDQRGEDLSKLEQMTRDVADKSEDFHLLAAKIKEKYQHRSKASGQHS